MSRPLWTGNINFGLVTIPVQLFPAVQDKDIHFHLMSPDGECRLRRKLYCPETGREFNFDKTARGYEIAPDQYVIVDQDELDTLRPESGRSIDIKAFVALTEVDPIYYITPYYLLPSDSGEKAFQLLTMALEKAEQVAIAKFIMREHEYLCSIRPLDRFTLCLETMRYADEIRSHEDISEQEFKEYKLEKKELELANTLIESLTVTFDPKKYKNEYRLKVKKLLEDKKEGKEISVIESDEKPKTAKVIDLMKVLQQSVSRAKESSKTRHSNKRKNSDSSHRKSATR